MTQSLVLRRATLADRDALVAFNADVLRYQDASEPDPGVAAWTQDLLDGRHPQVGLDDFSVVEDTQSGRIVSSLCLISQLLFGHRSLDELQYAFPDCLVRTEAARPLLTALFPKQPSNVWPVL